MKKTTEMLYLDEGMTLAHIVSELAKRDVTDLSEVRFNRTYVGCGGHSDGEYCYCEPSYSDLRFEWSK